MTAGALPTGLTLNALSGAVSGTPTIGGSANFTVTATDANGATGSRAYSVTIASQPPVVGAVSATVAANSSANP
ncbi:Ig domain-containing protein, partial [Ensifer sp. M14]|uniref:Ig domain-containing protein n=1 Tax=Ensifer sp. M14 TaxID=2203782 RepID=UPI001FCEB739